MATFLNIDNVILNKPLEFQLEGITYIIYTEWNSRSGWYISVSDLDNNLIFAGLKAMPDANLTWRYTRTTGLFTGDIWVDDTAVEATNELITRDNFGQGKRFQLVYRTQLEMTEGGIDPRDHYV